MVQKSRLLVGAAIPLVVLAVMTYFDSGLQQGFPSRSCERCDCEDNQTVNFRNMFRPRGALARALYNKQLMDCQLECMDHDKWYYVDGSQVPVEMRRTFLPLALDEETRQFLDNCNDKSDALLTQIWHSIVKSLLRWFLTQTDINGLLGRGSMFVFSKPHIRQLLGRSLAEEGDLLDLGAGDGLITQNLANFFSKIYVTEVSRPMRWALKKRGFQVLEVDGWSDRKYDVVSCLNLLDRCDRPYHILNQVRQALKPNGKAIFALVLPFQPYVENSGKGNQPMEVLPIQGLTLEQQAASVVSNILEPAGFTVVRWSKMPYLCEGDLHQAYYWLDDVVFVTRLTS
uniref:Methyltransferase-like protein 9 n=1 Tax=Graphocephala atropunctata TaxID=36148 RepID=A0A1B6M475_9HEMI